MNYKLAMEGTTEPGLTDSTSGSTTSHSSTSNNADLISQFASIYSMNENPVANISHKLNGRNYLEWTQSMRLFIDGKRRLGYVNGEVVPPPANDPGFKSWREENSMVTSWLINSMEAGLGKPYMFLPTAQDIWQAVKETYSDLDNYSQMFELNNQLWKMQQEDRGVTSYYHDMMAIWQELDLFETEEWENPNDSARYKKKVERGRVFVILARLNKDLEEVRGRILGRIPLPTIREVFSEAR
ncbi:hypothetical protein LguiB_021023 [Lonicera macranthoides]